MEEFRRFTGAHIMHFAHLQDGWTAIIAAAHNGHKDIVQLLISNGADFNHQTKVCIPLNVAESNRLKQQLTDG